MRLPLLLLVGLVISVFLELTIISFPLVFLLVLIIFTTTERFRILIPAAILSIIADALFLHPLGSTLLMSTGVLLLLQLYAYYFGSKDVVVHVLFVLLGVLIYTFIFGYSFPDLIRWYFSAGIIWIIYSLLPKQFKL